jgi:hypothetical protein
MEVRMRLDIAVMGHVTRLEQAHRLADQQHALLALDAGGLGENACGDLAWRYAAGRGDWSIVLQDDAVPVPYFREHALAALGELSLEPRDAVVSFYTGTGRARRGQNPPRHAHRVGIAPSWKPWPRVRIAASYAPVTPEVLTE